MGAGLLMAWDWTALYCCWFSVSRGLVISVKAWEYGVGVAVNFDCKRRETKEQCLLATTVGEAWVFRVAVLVFCQEILP